MLKQLLPDLIADAPVCDRPAPSMTAFRRLGIAEDCCGICGERFWSGSTAYAFRLDEMPKLACPACTEDVLIADAEANIGRVTSLVERRRVAVKPR